MGAKTKIDWADATWNPVFMKESLREIVGSDFRQEFPLEV